MNILQKSIPLFIMLALVGLGTGGYFYFQYQKTQKELQAIKIDQTTVKNATEQEVKNLVDEVGNMIVLPTGEEPTVAAITDIAQFRDQPFFKNAKNGDKVIIYLNSNRAILYDPIVKKVIDVAPVNIGTPSAQQATQQAKVALRNGTKTTGLTTRIETQLKKDFPQLNIVSKENAEKKDYEKTILVVLNDQAKNTADEIAKKLKVSVESLPAGETKPADTDIVIIIGKDKSP